MSQHSSSAVAETAERHPLSEMEAQQRLCPLCTICGQAMRARWRSAGYWYFGCPSCRFTSVVPAPSGGVLEEYYASSYVVDAEGYHRNVGRFGIRDIKLVETFCNRGRLLEIGSSWGFFLKVARDRGWQVKGIELSDSAASSARKDLRIDVFSGTLEGFTKVHEVASYDAIASWHVIEHVSNPVAFLRAARALLRPGGVIALRTPNIQSLPALLNGRHWQWVGAPAHLSLFSKEALTTVLSRAGFELLHIGTRRGDAHNPAFELLRGLALKLGVHRHAKHVLGLRYVGRGSDISGVDREASTRRSVVLRYLSSLFDVVLLPLIPIEKFLDVFGLGAELFVIAKSRQLPTKEAS